jgi:adenylosuccinate lyase
VTDRHDHYESALATRYAGEAMRRLFSARHRTLAWRRLWILLAESQRKLGLPIEASQVEAMHEGLERIDFDAVARYEARFRHDVMAHVHAFGDAAPRARGIVHLGATSCYVTDNADALILREALDLVALGLAQAIAALAAFSGRHKDVACLGYTHFQPAQPTTMGKRACVWLADLVDDLHEVERAALGLPFLGSKGATGTQASFLALFDGDAEKVEALDREVARRAGFRAAVPVSGQTYSRRADWKVLCTLGGVAISASRVGNDVRLLSGLGEVSEPFEAEQVGSSAMPYKRNPMRSERMTSLARYVLALVPAAGTTAAAQWLERTLDDSAARRLFLPEAFLGSDAVLRLLANVAQGLVVNEAVVRRRLADELPFLATEEVLALASRAGGDRQALHEAIRRHTLEARKAQQEGEPEADPLARIAADPLFRAVARDLPRVDDPSRFVGMAPRQVERFLEEHVEPAIEPFRSRLVGEVDVRV